MGDQFVLKNNQIFVLAEAAGGVYNSDQLRVLCEVADNESAFLKITEDQRIGFAVAPNRLGDVQAQVRKFGLLLRSYKSATTAAPRACLGELCTFAHQPSLGDALELTTHLLKSFPAPKRYSSIGVNGCQRACLGSSTEDIHIVAEETGYKVSIGGKGADIPQQAQLILENISRTDLPRVVEKILAVFYEVSTENEQIFDVIDRIGLTPFFDALQEHLTPTHTENEMVLDSVDAEARDVRDDSAEADDALEETQLSKVETEGLISEDPDNVDSKTVDALDDLLDSSSEEFADPLLNLPPETNEALSTAELELTPPNSEHQSISSQNEIDDPVDLGELEEITDAISEKDSHDLENDLLEVSDSDLEEGSPEDVERVRDAIRTELSLSANDNDAGPSSPKDLFESVGEDPDDSMFPDTEMSDVIQGLEEIEETPLLQAEHFEAPESDAAAHFEHQKQRIKSDSEQHSQQDPTRKHEKNKNLESSATPLPGRLSIRFIDDQLAIELPSGFSFELPFQSVSEDSVFEIALPDGKLIIHRDGLILVVNLGMLNLKIPIPNAQVLQVA